MQKLRFVLPLVFVAAFCGMALAAGGPTVVIPGMEKWAAQPGNYSMAVLYGDPSKAGFYVIRLKLPPHWAIAPHTHPARENVTVISGTFYAGLGTRANAATAGAYPAGSFLSIPPNVPHYALTKSAGAVIQLEGEGPYRVKMIKM